MLIKNNYALIVNKQYKNFLLIFTSLLHKIIHKKLISKKPDFLFYNNQLKQLYSPLRFQYLMENRLNSTTDPIKQILIFIEVDNLNAITEVIGFSSTEQLLLLLVENLDLLLQENLPIANYLIGYLHGPRFALLVSCTDCMNMLEYLINKYVNASSIPFDVTKDFIDIKYNIGIAIYPDHASSSYDLMNNCYLALSKARNDENITYTFFNKDILAEMTRKNKIIKILKTCVQNGEFQVYFQPQYNIKTHEIRGFEALSRLFTMELGLISPNEFIPLAEENGLMFNIGFQLINEVFLTILDFKRKNYDFKLIAINLSVLQLTNNDFINDVSNLIKKLGISSSNVEFELTEGTLITSFEHILKILNDLKALGITLAIDDFGTGYSSLSYLRSLPFDILKIDKSFIDHIVDDLKYYNIVKLIIQLAHELNLEVICEGVETLEQLNLLKDLGADIAQGYYLSKPLSKSDTEYLLHQAYSKI